MHQPTERVLNILEAVSREEGGMRLAELSRVLSIPKSTLLPILQTLCARKYLAQNGAGDYLPGTALFSLGAVFSGCFPILDYARQELEKLAEELGETCYCGVLEEGWVLYLCKAAPHKPLNVLVDPGRRLPAYATALGKALLMGKTEEELRALYPQGLAPLTARTVTSFSRLSEQLRQAEQEGFTWETEESTEHIRCFGAPVRKKGKTAAAVSVAIPLFRWRDEEKAEVTEALRACAARISATAEATDAHFSGLF